MRIDIDIYEAIDEWVKEEKGRHDWIRDYGKQQREEVKMLIGKLFEACYQWSDSAYILIELLREESPSQRKEAILRLESDKQEPSCSKP